MYYTKSSPSQANRNSPRLRSVSQSTGSEFANVLPWKLSVWGDRRLSSLPTFRADMGHQCAPMIEQNVHLWDAQFRLSCGGLETDEHHHKRAAHYLSDPGEGRRNMDVADFMMMSSVRLFLRQQAIRLPDQRIRNGFALRVPLPARAWKPHDAGMDAVRKCSNRLRLRVCLPPAIHL